MYQERQHIPWVRDCEDRRRLTTTCAPFAGAVLHSCTVLTVAAEVVKAWLADIAQQLQGERDVILLHFGLDNEATCIKLEVSRAPVAAWRCVQHCLPGQASTCTPGMSACNMLTQWRESAVAATRIKSASEAASIEAAICCCVNIWEGLLVTEP